MAAPASIARLIRNGTSICLILPRDLLAELGWNRDDRVAVRRYDRQLTIERIPLEQLALLRKPETNSHAQ